MKYRKSIIVDNFDKCYICHRPAECVHHALYGAGRREISEREGFLLPLCNYHHNMSLFSVHFDPDIDRGVKALFQKKYEETHTREDWIRLVGRNYID